MNVDLTHNELLHTDAAIAAELIGWDDSVSNPKRHTELISAQTKIQAALVESFKKEKGERDA